MNHIFTKIQIRSLEIPSSYNAQLFSIRSDSLAYLAGYVAFYRGDQPAALEQLQMGDPNDPFIRCLIGDAYDALGQEDKAIESYKKAASASAHTPATAFARPYATKKLAALTKK